MSHLSKQISDIIPDQGETDTCWNFSAARCIVRYYRKIFPKIFGIDSTKDCAEFYTYDTLYDIFDCKTEDDIPCSQKNYNSALLYAFVFAIFNIKYGCDANRIHTSFIWFFNQFLLKGLPSLLLDLSPEEVIIDKVKPDITFELTPEYYSIRHLVKILRQINEIRQQTFFTLHFTNYPKENINKREFTTFVKKMIDSGYYGIFEVPNTDIINHYMTLVGYEEGDDFFILVKNSWGENGGKILTYLEYTHSTHTRNLLKIAFTDLNKLQIYKHSINICYFEMSPDPGLQMTNYENQVFANLHKHNLLCDKCAEFYNMDGETLLTQAVMDEKVSVVKRLLESGYNPNQVNTNLVPAIITINIPILTLLLEHGADINQTIIFPSLSILYYAAERNKPKVVSFLLSKGANINIQLNNGDTPLHIACKLGFETVVRILLNDPNIKINITNDEGDTALHNACDHPTIVKMLLEKRAYIMGNNDENTPLHMTTNAKVTKMLIDAGAEPWSSNRFNQTPLHMISMKKGDHVKVAALLYPGVNVNQQDDDGQTALHLASSQGNVKIAELLIAKAHASIDIVNDNGQMPSIRSTRKLSNHSSRGGTRKIYNRVKYIK
jgi:ankyrin repeat protein